MPWSEKWERMDPCKVLERKQQMQENTRENKARRGLNQLFTEGDMREQDFRIRISPELHERLENWGWVMRPKMRRNISPTGIICHRLAVQAGVYKYDDADPPPTDAQKQDAHNLERAWRMMQTMKFKMLLAGYYIYRLHPHKIARAAAIRYGEFDEHMLRACFTLENTALRLASKIDAGDNIATI